MTSSVTLTVDAWKTEAEKRYGADKLRWRFRCPVCGHAASVADYVAASAPEGAIAFSCIGRFKKTCHPAFEKNQKAPCNYAGGGLLRLNPITVTSVDEEGQAAETHIFDFADQPLVQGRKRDEKPND